MQTVMDFLVYRLVRCQKPDQVEMFHMTVVETLPVMERGLRREAHRDALLSRVVRLVESGWEGVVSQPNLPQSQGRTDNAAWYSDVG